MMTEREVRELCRETCRRCGKPVEWAEDLTIDFNPRLTACAGRAKRTPRPGGAIYTVELSLDLLPRGTMEQWHETVVHEMCHIINYRDGYIGRRRVVHGDEWVRLMNLCGYTGERCHTIRRSDEEMGIVIMSCKCEGGCRVGPIIARKIRAKRTTRICCRCRTVLQYDGEIKGAKRVARATNEEIDEALNW